MWPERYDDRLSQWYRLRQENQHNDLKTALLAVNDWWQRAPWVPYYLHWGDMLKWPDPWQLLADNHFCSVAKALGILYTVAMMDRPDIASCELGEDRETGTNLVLVNEGKYILNWEPGQLLNISSQQIQIVRAVDIHTFSEKIR